MTTTDTPASSNGAGNDGLVQRIAKQRAERLTRQQITLPIPSWGGDLAARYGVIDYEQLQNLGDGKGADLDFLALACRAVLARDANGRLVELTHDGAPVLFDATLARMIDAPAQVGEDSRALVRYLLGDNQIAIGSHAMKLLEWMRDTSQEVEGALVGESVTPGKSTSSQQAPS